MLLRFSVENAFSFREEAVLNMMASSDRRHAERIATAGGEAPVLRTAGIYGANGHGKTKLVEAIRFCKRLIAGKPDAIEEDFIAFKLGAADDRRPGRFVFEFSNAGKQYEYGLLIDRDHIAQEWLIELRGRREVELFTRERTGDGQDGDPTYTYTFGAELRRSTVPNSKFKTADYLEFLALETPGDRAFLYEAAERRVSHLDDARRWFRDVLQPVGAESSYVPLQSRAAREQNFLAFLNAHMARSDTGIERLEVRRTHLAEDVLHTFLANAPDGLREAVESLEPGEMIPMGSTGGDVMVVERDGDGALSLLRMGAFRQAVDGREVAFSLDEESAGTQRLLDLYPMLYNLVEEDRVYVVDELDRKLHPLLAYEFIAEFLRAKRGQLIFTTHTTYLLDLDLLRRDDVWFVQKTGGSSTLYSLASFKVRPDLDVRKGYLNGRFGAIPFMGDTAALGWQREVDHGD